MSLRHLHGEAVVILTRPEAHRTVPGGNSLTAAYGDCAHAIVGSMRGSPYLFNFFVPAAQRGHGEALRLLENVRAYMREHGIAELRGFDTSDGYWRHLGHRDLGVRTGGHNKAMSVLDRAIPAPLEVRQRPSAGHPSTVLAELFGASTAPRAPLFPVQAPSERFRARLTAMKAARDGGVDAAPADDPIVASGPRIALR